MEMIQCGYEGGQNTVPVFNESGSYQGPNEMNTELAAAVLFVMNLEETSLMLYCITKKKKNGDLGATKRREKVKVIYGGEVTCVRESSGVSIFLCKLQRACFKSLSSIRSLALSMYLEALFFFIPWGDMNSCWAKSML